MGETYGPGDIQSVTGLAPVRRRPAMYIAGVDAAGLDGLVWAVVGRLVDDHLRRDVTEVHVDVTPDGWCSIRDDGPGISIELVSYLDRSVLETTFTTLHGRVVDDGHHPYEHLTQPRFDLGLAVVSALSASVEVETTRGGVRYAQRFARGERTSELHALGPASAEGTAIRFLPDPEIFTTVVFDAPRIAARLQELAWLVPQLRVHFQGRRLAARGGVRGLAEQLASERGRVVARFSTCRTTDDFYLDLALAWSDAKDGEVRSFVNFLPTTGGTHVDGMWQGLATAADALGFPPDLLEKSIRARLEPGLVAIVHVGLRGARWAGSVKEHLSSPTAALAVAGILARDVPAAAARYPALMAHLRGKSRLAATTHPPR